MQEIVEQWQTHFNAGDYEALTAFYTTDAVRFPPGAPPQNGHEAIAADFPSYADLTIKLELGGSDMSGDLLSSWGTYELYAREAEEGAGPVQSGPWMNVARMGEDGTWKITRDIWNLRQQPE
jgi:ketosteroid isomerase-like protein